MTPGVNREKGIAIAQFIDGPEYFESFDEILERTVAFNPTRSESSLRRGIMHNAVADADGRWRWRYDLPRRGSGEGDDGQHHPGARHAVGRDRRTYRGAAHARARVAVARRRRRRRGRAARGARPDARVVVFEGAGHSIQGDKPVELALTFLALTCSTGRPAPRASAWKPPMTSVARVQAEVVQRAAARLEQ